MGYARKVSGLPPLELVAQQWSIRNMKILWSCWPGTGPRTREGGHSPGRCGVRRGRYWSHTSYSPVAGIWGIYTNLGSELTGDFARKGDTSEFSFKWERRGRSYVCPRAARLRCCLLVAPVAFSSYRILNAQTPQKSSQDYRRVHLLCLGILTLTSAGPGGPLCRNQHRSDQDLFHLVSFLP